MEFSGAILQFRGAILPERYFAAQNLMVQTVYFCIHKLGNLLRLLQKNGPENNYPIINSDTYNIFSARRLLILDLLLSIDFGVAGRQLKWEVWKRGPVSVSKQGIVT